MTPSSNVIFFILADTVFRRFLSLTTHNRSSTEVPTCSGKEMTPIKSAIHRMPFCILL